MCVSVCMDTGKMQPKTLVAIVRKVLLSQGSEKTQGFLKAWPAHSKEPGERSWL